MVLPEENTRINNAPYFVDKAGNAYYRLPGTQTTYVVPQSQRGEQTAKVDQQNSFTVSKKRKPQSEPAETRDIKRGKYH